MASQALLREWRAAPDPSGKQRRWFTSDDFDLIVWFDDDASVAAFQLCYDRMRRERAITWARASGFSHNRIDDGEAGPWANRSPILVSDGVFPADEIAHRFADASLGIPENLRAIVLAKLREYPTATRGGETA